MKRPAFQFYPADWMGNTKLRRCTFAEHGIWIAVLCLLHGNDEYGLVRWPLKELAQAAGCKLNELKGLIDKGVLKGSDQEIDEYTFTPTHAGKKLTPVVLLPKQKGPVWYCSRMVRDEYIRSKRGSGTRFDGTPNYSPKGGIGEEPNETPSQREGDGASTSSSSSISLGGALPPPSQPEKRKRKAPETPCPENFTVTTEMQEWAESKGLDDKATLLQTERFLAHHGSKGNTFADWGQAWRNWVLKSIEYRAGP